MRSNLDGFFKAFTDKLVFIELEDKKILEKFGKVEKGFMVPVFSTDIVKMATNPQSGITSMRIIESVLYLLGIDDQFKFNEIYLRFLRTSIEKPEALASSIAKQKYENKNYRDAMIYLRAGMLLSESNTGIIYNYAHICKEYMAEAEDKELKQLLFKEAQEFFEAVLDIDDKNYLAHYQLAYFKISQNEMEEAIEHLENVIKYSEDDEINEEVSQLIKDMSLNEKLEVIEELIEEMDLEAALSALEELPDEVTDKAMTFRLNYARGFCLKAFSLFEESIAAYEKALSIDNTDTLLLCELGICYAYIGEFEQALEFYLAALDIEPTSLEIISNVAIIYLNMKDVENANLYIKRAADINPHDEIVESTMKEIRRYEEAMN